MVRIAYAVVGCVSLLGLAGCAAEPLPKKGAPVDENAIDVPARAGDDGADDNGDITVPITPVEADDLAVPPTETQDRTTPPQGGDPIKPGTGTGTGTGAGTGAGAGTGTGPKPPTGGTPPAPSVKTQSCTSTTGNYQALTTITYTVSNGVAKISKMTVKVTNPNNRDENDVDVYVNGSKAFNSGDILKNGQTIELPKATTLDIKSGAKVKILTNFDRVATDPSADCVIDF